MEDEFEDIPGGFWLNHPGELYSVFLPWFEKSLIEVHACSVLPEFGVMHMVTALLLRLRDAADQLGAIATERNNGKLIRFAEHCRQAVSDLSSNIPVCMDQEFFVSFSKSLTQRVKELESMGSAIKGNQVKGIAEFKSVREVVAKLSSAMDHFKQHCSDRAPILAHLSSLKREVRNPIDNFIHALEDANLRASSSKHLSTSTTPQSHHKPSAHSTPAQRKERAAERLRELSHKSSFVSDALQFEQEAVFLFKRMLSDLKPFQSLANYLTHHLERGSSVLKLEESMDRRELEQLHLLIRNLADEPPPKHTKSERRRSKDTHPHKQASQATPISGPSHILLKFANMGEVGGEFLMSLLQHLLKLSIHKSDESTRQEVDAIREELDKFDLEMFGVMFADWTQRIQRQKEIQSHEDVKEFQAQQAAYEKASKECEKEEEEYEYNLERLRHVQEAYAALQTSLRDICAREFKEEVVVCFPDEVEDLWSPWS